jgi:type IV pilus assembly protein PilY1
MIMKINKTTIFLRTTLIAVVGVALNAYATISIPDVPLYMNSTGVKPNFVLTLDDSGSMQWGYVPDARSNGAPNRYKSSYYNGIYYNPSVQYYAPPKYNRPVGSDNCPLNSNATNCFPNAVFTAANINGFDSTRGTVNLSNDYKAVTTYSPSNITQSFAGSPTGSTDRTYYASSGSSGSITTITARCKVKFNSRSGDERLELSIAVRIFHLLLQILVIK